MAMLTKAQWRRGPRKSGTYARYVAWYRRTQPVAGLKPWNQAQIDNAVNQRVENILRPQRQELERQEASRVYSLQQGAKASSAILNSRVGQVGAAYNAAAEELKSIGGGYSDAMKARIQGAQDAAAQFSASQGAPTPNQGTDATALADTSYHGAVGIPGATLASQGANWTAMEAEQAGIPLLQGAVDVRQAQRESEQALLELAQKRPELADQIRQQIFENEMAKLDARIKQQAQDAVSAQFGETVRHHRVGEAQAATRNRLSRLRYDLQVQSHQDAMDKAAAEGRLPNASLSRAYGYIVDKGGHPILDRNGKKIPVAKSTSAKSQKEKSNAQVQKAVGEAEKMYRASRPTYKIDPATGDKIRVDPKRAWRWGNALRYLMNRYGIKRAAARRALIAAGFRPPGNKGTGNPGGTQAATPNYGGRGGQ